MRFRASIHNGSRVKTIEGGSDVIGESWARLEHGCSVCRSRRQPRSRRALPHTVSNYLSSSDRFDHATVLMLFSVTHFGMVPEYC